MIEPKRCSDCKHCKPNAGGWKYAECLRSERPGQPSPVHPSLDDEPFIWLCTFYRGTENCGTEGKLWEPK